MDTVKLGIIGFGAQGGAYADFIEQGRVNNIKIGAICDNDPDKKQIVNDKNPNIAFYDNYKDMLESGDVDGIVTTVPHYLHPERGIEALKRNIHALVEKPSGVYTRQVKELNDFAATRPDVTFAIMVNQRTNALYEKVKEIVDNGKIDNVGRPLW